MRLPGFVVRPLLAWARRVMASRPRDVAIGGLLMPYMERWHVLPRNDWLNLYVHRIRRSDDDRALHDHRGANLSVVLSGGYVEHRLRFPRAAADCYRMDHPAYALAQMTISRGFRPGAVVVRRAATAHRLELPAVGGPVVTLFMTFWCGRTWGFWCPLRWVPHYEFVDPDDPGATGPGCG